MIFPNKKCIIPLLIVALPLMAMMPWKAKKLRGYFPLTEGSMWQYNLFSHVEYHVVIHDSIFCAGDTMINGKRYAVIAGKKNEKVFPSGYWRFEKTALYRYHTTQKHDVLFADFSKHRGEVSTCISDSLDYTVRVLSTDTTYKIPERRKISWSDQPPERLPYAHVYCVEWTEKKRADTVILFFKQQVGLVGLKMGNGEELYLNSWVVERR